MNKIIFGLLFLSSAIGLSSCAEDSVSSFKYEIELKDYSYAKNQHFFLTHAFRNNFENYDPATGLRVLPSDIASTAPDTVRAFRLDISSGQYLGVAHPDPENPDPFEQQSGLFLELAASEFSVNTADGMLSLADPLSDNDALAVAYVRTDGDTVGDFGATTQDTVLLVLIKARNQKVANPTWNLEVKNLYSFDYVGASKIKVAIQLVIPGAEPETELPDGRNLLSVFGLDVANNSTGSLNPDGRADLENPVLFNLDRGYLRFPYLEPFTVDSAAVPPAYYGPRDLPEEIKINDVIPLLLDRSTIYTYDRSNPESGVFSERYRIVVKVKE